MRNLRVAVTFLTRIPLPVPPEPDLAAAVAWYPVAGGLVGLAVGGAAAGLVHLVAPFAAAAAAVVLAILITGAFHEDGLADVADAFAGGWTRDERMRILKDPLHGSYGVAALCGSIVVRVACIGSLATSPAVTFACVVASHILGRCAAVALIATVPAASTVGLAAGATGAGRSARRSARRGSIGIGIGTALVALAAGWWVVPFATAAVLAAGATGWLAVRKIGGITGDVLGTAEQVTECLVLLTATALASRSALWWAA